MASLAVLIQTHLLAGGWPQDKKTGYLKLGQTGIIATSYFDVDGTQVPIRTLGNYTTYLYGEYGVTSRITVLGFIPFYVRNTFNETVDANTGTVIEPGGLNQAFGDTDLGLRIGLLRKGPFVLSLGLLAGLPTGQADSEIGLPTGDGEFNQLVKLEAGISLPKNMYATAALGFNNRTQNFSDEIRYEAEWGFQPAKKLWAILKLSGIQPINNGDAAVAGGPNGLFANRVQYMAFGPEVSYNVSRQWGVTGSVFGAFAIKNALGAPSLNVGVFYTPGK
ncbi:MAG: hypothetical protein OHK0039_23050 [Bacteroidia bacterium]